MMTTNEKELYKKFLLFRGHEITRDKNFIYEKKGDWYYKQICLNITIGLQIYSVPWAYHN